MCINTGSTQTNIEALMQHYVALLVLCVLRKTAKVCHPTHMHDLTQQRFNIDSGRKQHAWLIVSAHLTVEYLLMKEPASNMTHTSGASRTWATEQGGSAEGFYSSMVTLLVSNSWRHKAWQDKKSKKSCMQLDWQCCIPLRTCLAALLGQSVNLVVSLQWSHGSLADLNR